MSDALEQVLELVAQGRLTADQAAPILDALSAQDDAGPADDDRDPGSGAETRTAGREAAHATAIRIEVTEAGRKIVNLRIPVSLGRIALDRIPGLSETTADLVRQALADGRSGTLLHVDDEDDGVRIALE
jgi:hypothetical protein